MFKRKAKNRPSMARNQEIKNIENKKFSTYKGAILGEVLTDSTLLSSNSR